MYDRGTSAVQDGAGKESVAPSRFPMVGHALCVLWCWCSPLSQGRTAQLRCAPRRACTRRARAVLVDAPLVGANATPLPPPYGLELAWEGGLGIASACRRWLCVTFLCFGSSTVTTVRTGTAAYLRLPRRVPSPIRARLPSPSRCSPVPLACSRQQSSGCYGRAHGRYGKCLFLPTHVFGVWDRLGVMQSEGRRGTRLGVGQDLETIKLRAGRPRCDEGGDLGGA